MARVLVVDDEVPLRGMLKEMLELSGHKVVEAPDGRMAIKLFNDKPADLVITDIIMPEKDGIETIFELRRDFPNIKIIAISGGGRIPAENHLFTATVLGAHKALTKPFDLVELLGHVQELLNK